MLFSFLLLSSSYFLCFLIMSNIFASGNAASGSGGES